MKAFFSTFFFHDFSDLMPITRYSIESTLYYFVVFFFTLLIRFSSQSMENASAQAYFFHKTNIVLEYVCIKCRAAMNMFWIFFWLSRLPFIISYSLFCRSIFAVWICSTANICVHLGITATSHIDGWDRARHMLKMYALMFMLFTFSFGASLSNFRKETPLTIMVPVFCFNQMQYTNASCGRFCSRSLSNCLVAHSNCIYALIIIWWTTAQNNDNQTKCAQTVASHK